MGKLWLVMREDVWVRKGNRLFSWPRGVTAEMARQWGAKSSHIGPSTTWDMATICKIGLMIVVGLPKLMVQRQNPLVKSTPPRANRVRDKATERVPNS
jgi:hypothetical protein